MAGFFTKKETESKTRPDGKTYSCYSCGLYKNAKSAKMQPVGEFKKEILILGSNPTRVDDEENTLWLDNSGRFLRKTLTKFNIDIYKDCLSLNAVNCYPANHKVTNFEIDSCRFVMVQKIIMDYQPKVVILLGEQALYSFLGQRTSFNVGEMDKWRGWIIPDRDFKTFVCPMYSPEEVVSNKSIELTTIWENDLQQALKQVSKPWPSFKKPNIHIIEDLSILDTIQSGVVAFDYETTGLKPQAFGHRIICASVAVDENTAYTFLFKNRKQSAPFYRLLKNPQVSKMAHNMKFEDTWTTNRLKFDVVNWGFDSMQAAHILDNRPGVCGLKFQTYVNFGVVDYSSEITPYLRSAKGGNEINTIHKLLETPDKTKQLLMYCALDSIYEYRLAMKQIDIMNYDFLPF